jgi:hypothetical protein
MIDAVDPALQQRKETFRRVAVNLATHVFTSAVIDRLVIGLSNQLIGAKFVAPQCRIRVNVRADGFAQIVRSSHGRSSQVRSRLDRTRLMRRPQPLHVYRRIPRRSIRISNRPSSPSSIVTTRNPQSPRTHVQSRRDPTCPPLLLARQERTPFNPGWPRWDRASMSRPASRPPTPIAVRAGGRVSRQIAYRLE